MDRIKRVEIYSWLMRVCLRWKVIERKSRDSIIESSFLVAPNGLSCFLFTPNRYCGMGMLWEGSAHVHLLVTTVVLWLCCSVELLWDPTRLQSWYWLMSYGVDLTYFVLGGNVPVSWGVSKHNALHISSRAIYSSDGKATIFGVKLLWFLLAIG